MAVCVFFGMRLRNEGTYTNININIIFGNIRKNGNCRTVHAKEKDGARKRRCCVYTEMGINKIILQLDLNLCVYFSHANENSRGTIVYILFHFLLPLCFPISAPWTAAHRLVDKPN